MPVDEGHAAGAAAASVNVPGLLNGILENLLPNKYKRFMSLLTNLVMRCYADRREKHRNNRMNAYECKNIYNNTVITKEKHTLLLSN